MRSSDMSSEQIPESEAYSFLDEMGDTNPFDYDRNR